MCILHLQHVSVETTHFEELMWLVAMVLGSTALSLDLGGSYTGVDIRKTLSNCILKTSAFHCV